MTDSIAILSPGERAPATEPAAPRSCDACDFWLKVSEIYDGPGADRSVVGVRGMCRRHAPTIKIIGSRQLDPWPLTLGDDRCGEFKAKP